MAKKVKMATSTKRFPKGLKKAKGFKPFGKGTPLPKRGARGR